MNDFEVKFEGGNFSNSGSALRLINQSTGESFGIRHNFSGFSRLRSSFSSTSLDLVYLALAAYGCDRAVSRKKLDERWTRDIALTLPVEDLSVWQPLAERISTMLSFLTGDRWYISFQQRTVTIFGKEFIDASSRWRKQTAINGSVVSLFSGGLDSYIGVIDWLNQNRAGTLTLSGAYDPAAEGARSDQRRLFSLLAQQYPQRVELFTSRMGISGKGQESTYRSRSFCFIAFGILASAFQENGSTVLIPENGPIALNYPLSPARYGSSSTRTVHPFFIHELQRVVTDLGLNVSLENPYRFRTKGEMVADCLDMPLLRASYSQTASCGNRKRFKTQVQNRNATQCGFCVPCLYRRAALHSVGLDGNDYGAQVEDSSTWGKAKINEPNKNFSDVCEFVRANESDAVIRRRILANGKLDTTAIQSYVGLVKRQRNELKIWLNSLGLL